jgi:hypothetical protein
MLLLGCSGPPAGEAPRAAEKPAEPTLPNGLVLSFSMFGKDAAGKPVPQPARLGILTKGASGWSYREVVDPDSNVFHKAMVYEPAPGKPGLLTLGGTRAILELRRPGATPEIVWEADFGGQFSRMRDAEYGDLYGNGVPTLAVATHDQGVVATVAPGPDGKWVVRELDRQPDTIVHEIELGDLDHDGTLEIYATPSSRNTLDGKPQPGAVTRYVPARGEGRTVVADLGDRHAKEILVYDLDRDGKQELYAVVEAVSGGTVEIRRYDAGTDPTAGVLVATLEDKLCRFLNAGDFDGDGRPELVAAAHKSGLWRLVPGASREERFRVESIDADSGGFEHASLLADLDGDGTSELYVASDKDKQVRRYVWREGKAQREVILAHPKEFSGLTWNIAAVPVELLP